MAKAEQAVESLPDSTPAMHDAAAILASINIEELLKGQLDTLVEQRVSQELEKQRVNQGNRVVLADKRGDAHPKPPSFLKHYRCDVSPNLVVFARSVVKDESGNATGLYKPTQWSTDAKRFRDPDPVAGLKIQFRRGHFFATEQWQVDQLDWMMKNKSVKPGSDSINPEILGGNPTIYEDDGIQIGGCPHCGEPFVPGSNALKAHMRATHGVEVA